MPGYHWISLTTDYGLTDGFVAACHGMLARIAPAIRVIDVTHLVPPADVARGAAVLAQTAPYLPDAVHVAVVDPGVGTQRRGIALRTPRGALVGPDNGLLLPAADALGGVREAVELTNPAWFAGTVSHTFHGRDIFAPVAANLALGHRIDEAGPQLDPADLVRLPEPAVEIGAGWLTAPVRTVDHFGNVQLGADASVLAGLGPRLRVGEVRATRAETFGVVPPGDMVVYGDSAGLVAVAVNGGRAADVLGVSAADPLRIETVD